MLKAAFGDEGGECGTRLAEKHHFVRAALNAWKS